MRHFLAGPGLAFAALLFVPITRADPLKAGRVIVSDTFDRADPTTGENVTGRAPEIGPAGARYVTSVVTEQAWGKIARDPAHGNPAPSARLAWDEKEAVSLETEGATLPPALHIAGDLCTGTLHAGKMDDVVGLGFFNNGGGGHGFDGFTGLALRADGSLVLMSNGQTLGGSSVPYAGTFDKTAFHTLAYSVDTGTGALYDVRLDGQPKTLPPTSVFLETAAGIPTRCAGFFVSGYPNGTAYVDNFAVSEAAPPDTRGLARPPIPVHFTLRKPATVTLVIDDAQGKRVRNLVSETKFPAGENTVYWDGLDDLGRDPDAAAHAVYYIPGKLVAPGTYKVRGLTRDSINLRYKMAPYSHGDPPWNNGDSSSWWLANHTPPQSALFVPSAGKDKKPTILVGSYVSEGGSGLAWLDVTGRKYNGQGWIGGAWTGAPFLARDTGPHALPDNYAYAGAAWSSELRLTAITDGGTKPVLSPAYEFPGVGAWNNTVESAAIGGLAVRNGLLVATLPKLNGGQLLFVDVAARKALGTTPLPDGRGLIFDAQGRLLVLSGHRLLRFALPGRADLPGFLDAGPTYGTALDRKGWKATASVNPDETHNALDGDYDSHWQTKANQTPGQTFTLDLGTPQTFDTLVMNCAGSDDFPKAYEIAVSDDGQTWGKPLATGAGGGHNTVAHFPAVTTRYVKITQTGSGGNWWAITEINLYHAPLHGAMPPAKPLPKPAVLVSGSRPPNAGGIGKEILTPPLLGAGGPSLQDPQQITLDSTGRMYVSDAGLSQQVKVFAPSGQFLRAIGHPGAPQAGPYDPQHMNHPQGLTIDSRNRLWVAENDFQPKRVSVWTLDGKLVNAFYGPPRYGGGGEMDPQDKSRWLYDGMTFGLDWQTRTAKPTDIFYRPGPEDFGGNSFSSPTPQTPLYAHGQEYLTNCYNSSPTNGASIAGLWRMGTDGVAHAVAALGVANDLSFFQGLSPRVSNISVRWTGTITPKFTEPYTFTTVSDDGVRLWVNGNPLVDDWAGHGATENKGTITLQAGHRYPIRVEYYNGSGGGTIHLYWTSAHHPRALVAADKPGFTGHYYRGINFDALQDTRMDAQIDTDWPQGIPVDPKLAGYAARLPAGADPGKSVWDNAVFFLWTDTNGDGRMQPGEVTFEALKGGPVDGVTVMPDLSFVVTNMSGETRRYAPSRFSPAGVPIYDAAQPVTLATGAQHPTSSGGGQTLLGRDGWMIETIAPAPFAPQGLGGVRNGVPVWSYPSLWPGLHASHIAPMPDHPGELIGTTRLIGGTITPKGGDAGELWAVNGNKGTIYVFTTDGLFVATLFHDSRAASWSFPQAVPDMLVNDASNNEEDFWPQWTQADDGDIYLTTGDSYLLHVEGLETIARLPDAALEVTPQLLTQARAYFLESEAQRQAAQAANESPLTVAVRPNAPVMDGKMDDWAGASWVTVDTRANQQGDWGRSEAKVQAALAISGDRLYAAYQTGDRDLLRNDGSNRPLLFKTGGALDVMLDAVPGGERLLVTQAGGKTAAMLYQPRTSNGKTSPFEFTSPQRTLKFDRVEDVSSQVTLASDGQGNYEVSVPLSLLGLTAQAGQTLRGDVGILRGNGFQTLQRVYWRNKATGLVSDIPSEAELTPQLWGTWVVK